MKKIFLFFLMSIPVFSYSQLANAVLFTENGEKFTAILNGLKQNEKPETQVKITGLNAEFYKLKVIFDSQNLGEKNFNLAVEPGKETAYCIKKNNNGEYVIRLVSSSPISSPIETQVPVNNSNSNQNTVTQQTTTTTNQTGSPQDVNFNLGFSVNDNGGNVSMQMSGIATESDMTESNYQSQTVITTTTTTTSSDGVPHSKPEYLPGYHGPVGCPAPMHPQDFSDLKKTISAKSFEETRLTIAKQVTGNQCLFTSQVTEILNLFSFEETKLDFAKYAYRYTYDRGNYFKVNDVFTFETTTEELNEYINSQR